MQNIKTEHGTKKKRRKLIEYKIQLININLNKC
jgi:hypothetical protein